jgi:hypothetical protein
MPETLERIEICVPDSKERFAEWIANRGGVIRWRNLNLSNPNAGDHYTPVRGPNGEGNQQSAPHWSVGFAEIITDLSRFRFVKELKEVKRIKIAVRMGSQGLSLKLTDGSSNRLRKAMSKIQEQHKTVPCYHFEGPEAVIQVPVFEN